MGIKWRPLGGPQKLPRSTCWYFQATVRTNPATPAAYSASEIDGRVIEDAHSRLGVPYLIDALCERIERLTESNTPATTDITKQTVEALLLAAHGATLMSLAGAPSEAINARLVSFSRLIQTHHNQETLQ